jgi:SAM-dependent methyltransferase
VVVSQRAPSPDSPDSLTFYEEEARATERYASVGYWDARYHRRRMAAVERVLGRIVKPGDRFVDAGCGTGEYLSFARQLGAKPVGIDLAVGYLMRIRAAGVTDLLQADLARLPLESGAVEVALCSEVLEHLPEPELATQELLRVAGRSVVISTPNIGVLRSAFKRFAPAKVAELDRSVGHISVMHLGQLLQLVKNSGWRATEVGTLHVLPPVIMEMLHLPSFFEPLVRLAEAIMSRLLPRQGNISLVLLERSKT